MCVSFALFVGKFEVMARVCRVCRVVSCRVVSCRVCRVVSCRVCRVVSCLFQL
jgi:hypothetical protein